MPARKSRRSPSGRKYSEKASATIGSAMRRRKRGTLETRGGRKVTSRKQALAIGLSEAREKGEKVPRKRTSSETSRSAVARTSARKSSTARPAVRKAARKTARKSTARKSGRKSMRKQPS